GRLTEGDSGTSPPAGSCPQACSSSVWFGEKSPVLVSEGGLEPPFPLRALAPQASASAYSATRTRDARGTHRLSYLSKPNAPRRVPRPLNLATRRHASSPARARTPSPAQPASVQ